MKLGVGGNPNAMSSNEQFAFAQQLGRGGALGEEGLQLYDQSITADSPKERMKALEQLKELAMPQIREETAYKMASAEARKLVYKAVQSGDYGDDAQRQLAEEKSCRAVRLNA
ncbi:hypothetical protein OAS86_06645 [Gammaproteobacteria bacterium]|nr:hypothetical protein [Gammaproteobacteria bacterium]